MQHSRLPCFRQRLLRNRAWSRTAAQGMRVIGALQLGLICKYLIYNE